MDIKVAIMERRSIRKWQDKDVPQGLLKELIDAARWAPTSCNRQAWRFLVIKDAERKKQFCKLAMKSTAAQATVLIAVFVDARPYRLPLEERAISQDAAAAVQNLLLRAHSLGLGACWFYGRHENKEEIAENFKVPSHLQYEALIGLGFPAEIGKKHERVKEVLFFETF